MKVYNFVRRNNCDYDKTPSHFSKKNMKNEPKKQQQQKSNVIAALRIHFYQALNSLNLEN